MRRFTIGIVAALLTTSAYAQIPAGPGQQPGTLPPAPPIIRPPPLVCAAAGALRGHAAACLRPTASRQASVTRAPSYGGGGTICLSYPKKRKNPRKSPHRPAPTQ